MKLVVPAYRVLSPYLRLHMLHHTAPLPRMQRYDPPWPSPQRLFSTLPDFSYHSRRHSGLPTGLLEARS
eukprot:3227599-Rhodomonas_salina.1